MAMASVRSFWVYYRWSSGSTGPDVDLQSKCGIRKDGFYFYFDFSMTIFWALSTALWTPADRALDISSFTDRMPLWNEEVAEAFDHLSKRARFVILGCPIKIPWWWELLKTASSNLSRSTSCAERRLFTPSFAGFHVNIGRAKSSRARCSVFEYCRLTTTVWFRPICPPTWLVIYKFLVGKKSLRPSITSSQWLGEKYQVSTAIALAWVLRYPGKMQATSSERPSPMPWSRKAATATYLQGMVPKSTWLQGMILPWIFC